MKRQRFQNIVTAGRLTLPAAILISVVCWVLTASLLPSFKPLVNNNSIWNILNFNIYSWAHILLSSLLYSLIGYIMIELNNMFAIIRMRASMQTTIYVLMISICPSIHILYIGNLAALTFLIALFLLFKSYQQSRSAGDLFHSFVFLGIGSLLFPQLTLFAPLFWIGAYSFQSLHSKSFFASLVGWSLPYWLLLGYSYSSGQMELFCKPFKELFIFSPIQFSFQPWELATLGYLLLLYIVSSCHCLMAAYQDKIRTRSYLHFLILLNLCIFVYIGLQPASGIQLLPILFIGVSFLAGHLFVLTSSRSSNIFFIFAFIGLFILFAFNIWTLL